MAEAEYEIAALGAEELDAFQAHFERHIAESGRGEPVFMPFAPEGPDGPKGLDAQLLRRGLDDLDWQRLWVARDVHTQAIVGHVDLKGDFLRVGLHRCHLGLGVERPYRRRGLGRRLVGAAVDFARRKDSLAWIDLKVFAHNAGARALYESLGFVEVGRHADRFRIDGATVDDVSMALNVEAGR